VLGDFSKKMRSDILIWNGEVFAVLVEILAVCVHIPHIALHIVRRVGSVAAKVLILIRHSEIEAVVLQIPLATPVRPAIGAVVIPA
jgi:hypothetical protein